MEWVEAKYECDTLRGTIRVRREVGLYCPACKRAALYTTGGGSKVYYCAACLETFSIVGRCNTNWFESIVNRAKAKAIQERLERG